MVVQNDEHAVILLDSDTNVVAWLGAAEKIFGFSPEEITGKPFRVLFSPEDLAKGMPRWEVEVASKSTSTMIRAVGSLQSMGLSLNLDPPGRASSP